MVAGVAYQGVFSSVSSDDGFTELEEIFFEDTNGFQGDVWIKEATSSDVSRGSSSWSGLDSTDSVAAYIMRISSAAVSEQRRSNSDNTNAPVSSPVTLSAGVTPQQPDSILIFTAFASPSDSMSGYSIATDDPTWTERADLEGDSATGADTRIAVATANRSETTSTGDVTFSFSGNADGAGAVLVSLVEKIDATVNVGVLTADASLKSSTQSGKASVTTGKLTASASIKATSQTAGTNPWSNQSRSTGNWSNQTKS